MQSTIIENRNTCFLTKTELRKDIVYVHHLFACDIEIFDNTVVYFLTKSDAGASLSVTLILNGYNGSFKKIKLLAEHKDELKMAESFYEVNPSESPDVLENIQNRFYKKIKEDEWKLR